MLDGLRSGVHRLIWESLQPQNPRKHGARIHAVVDWKPIDLLTVGNLVVT